MIIALFRNRLKPESKHLAISIREFLAKQKVELAAEDDDAEEIGAKPLSQVDAGKVAFLLTLGGDGTILRAIHRHPELTAPIFGINLGGLGFMADIPVTELYPALQDLLKGNFKITERLLMEGEEMHGDKSLALNEFTFHRAENPSLVDLAIHVDGTYLNTFSADGVIIATPCGSTAYSLAAGGPILSPELDAFVITPICPHTISNRPIVLMPKESIQVQFLSELAPIEVSADGQKSFRMKSGEVFTIRRGKKVACLVNLHHHDYFATLREKLGWSGKLKSASK